MKPKKEWSSKNKKSGSAGWGINHRTKTLKKEFKGSKRGIQRFQNRKNGLG